IFDTTIFRPSILEPAALLIDERDRDSFALARQAWLDQVKHEPDNAVVLYRAAIALGRSDSKLATDWFKKVIRIDSGPRGSTARRLLGRLYADAVMGITARTPLQKPGPADSSAARSSLARSAKDAIEHSTDVLTVAEAGAWLYETSD